MPVSVFTFIYFRHIYRLALSWFRSNEATAYGMMLSFSPAGITDTIITKSATDFQIMVANERMNEPMNERTNERWCWLILINCANDGEPVLYEQITKEKAENSLKKYTEYTQIMKKQRKKERKTSRQKKLW